MFEGRLRGAVLKEDEVTDETLVWIRATRRPLGISFARPLGTFVNPGTPGRGLA